MIPPPPPPPPPLLPKKPKVTGKPRGPVRGGKWRAGRTEIDLGGVDPRARAKFVGLIAYVRSLGMSLRQIWQQTPLDEDEPDGTLIADVVEYDAFCKWAREDKWEDEREKLWQYVKRRSLEVVGGEMVTQEIAAIHRLDALRSRVEERFEDTEAKSFEGLVAVMLRLEEMISGKRYRLSELLPRALAAEASTEIPAGDGVPALPAPPALEDELTDEDFATMIHAVLQRRIGKGASP